MFCRTLPTIVPTGRPPPTSNRLRDETAGFCQMNLDTFLVRRTLLERWTRGRGAARQLQFVGANATRRRPGRRRQQTHWLVDAYWISHTETDALSRSRRRIQRRRR